MKGTVLALASLALLITAQEGKGEGNSMRLCGRDFVRAIVFTCGGSRWKRHLADYQYLFGKYLLTHYSLIALWKVRSAPRGFRRTMSPADCTQGQSCALGSCCSLEQAHLRCQQHRLCLETASLLFPCSLLGIA
uniref:Uncharacterized protein n=1 Tax=Melopsittacus undulatus TaxID=13146 RepID=A0A8C6JMA3_MELUD